jgi:hypothetical protein
VRPASPPGGIAAKKKKKIGDHDESPRRDGGHTTAAASPITYQTNTTTTGHHPHSGISSLRHRLPRSRRGPMIACLDLACVNCVCGLSRELGRD